VDFERLSQQTREIFRIEAEELLTELETGLLALEENPTEGERINHVFRALHTLKGSGATSGFASLSGFLHQIEDVFSLARDGAVVVDSVLVDLTLELRDVIAAHVRAAPDLAEEILQGAQPLLQRFLAYLPEDNELPDAPLTATPARERKYRLRFAPHPEFFRFGHDPRALIEELRELSSDFSLTAHLENLPDDDAYDPECCYVAWTIELTTSQPRDAIDDVFMFVEDECTLEVDCLSKDEPAPSIARVEEKQASRSPAQQAAGETMRVAAEKLDRLVDMVGELVILRSQVSNACGVLDEVPTELSSASEALQRLTVDLRDLVLDVRTMPIGETFAKFHRLCRDLSRDLEKKVKLQIEGGETAMDKNVLEQLRDPLLHLIRNALDHGVELPAERTRDGKPETATLHLSDEQRGERVWITVRDDGRGIDPAKVRAKAITRGLLTEDSTLTDEEIQQFVFHPGFSTADKVSEVSGRGVGLDVVKKHLELLRGNIHLESKPGEGTTIHLSVPLTLAIIDGLLVRIDGDRYVFPLSAARETIELTAAQRLRNNGRNIVELRGKPLPYLRLRELFDYETSAPEIEKVVVVELENQRIGLVIDEVIGHHQTVLKSLGWLGKEVDVFAGATVLANGHIGLICDLPALLRLNEQREPAEELACAVGG